MTRYPESFHDGSLPPYQPQGVPDTPLNAVAVCAAFADKLVEAGEKGTPIPLRDPRELAGQIERLARTLRWSVLEGGQLTDQRAVTLGAYILGFVLARARVRELDITAGDANAG